ncbi:hypothetical protein TFLX_02832 [Thermoflexales bacterium]|nr:hypothetical protein TFLX_02832 [Thermoflexales bacterium]
MIESNTLVLLIIYLGLALVTSALLISLLKRSKQRARWSIWIELALIALWTIWVGRDLLNFDRTLLLNGREFGMSIQSHFVWQWLGRCQLCVLWDGSINGGAPAFTELHGAVLHPVVVITSILFGAINGAKITLLVTLFMAGFAQWWLARVMGLGQLPRLWIAAMAVVAGNLSGRMESGLLAESLSTAACALTLAPGLQLALTGQRRATVLLAITLALAITAGQGYLQVGLVLGLLPAYLVFFFDKYRPVWPIWKEFLLAGVLSLLLAGLFLVPLAHFWPNFIKGTGTGFSSAQALEYAPLNLVIRDFSFYMNESLGKWATPHMYINFIGWVPILLAVIAFRLVPRRQLRTLLFLLVAIGLVFLSSSAVTLRMLEQLRFDFIRSVRYASVIGGLAVPLVLALAGWGLHLLVQCTWPRLSLRSLGLTRQKATRSVSMSYVVLALPLLWSLVAAYDFSRPWLKLNQTHPHVYQTLQLVAQPTTQWIELIYGEQFWTPAALDADMKLAKSIRPWDWRERDLPQPFIQATRNPQEVVTTSVNYLGQVGELLLVKHPHNEYAYVDTGQQQVPCAATALGGNIDVECTTEVAGKLLVTENSWTGWQAYRDGTPVTLDNERWLSVAAPAGSHRYEFRYRPWDVWVGLLLTLVGVALCLVWWIRSPRAKPPAQADVAPPSETNSSEIPASQA